MATYNKKDTQSKIQKLGELMTAKKYDEAWTAAGELSAYLKAHKDVMTGSDYEAINSVIKNYYNINNQIEAVGKRAYSMGQKALNTQL
jgi:NDP-sugar pyrophosphorylase family protein